MDHQAFNEQQFINKVEQRQLGEFVHEQMKENKKQSPAAAAASGGGGGIPTGGVVVNIDCRSFDGIRFFYCSNIMPEHTKFKVHELPVVPKKEGKKIMRVLIIAGNLSAFASSMNTILFKHFIESGNWEFIVYVPGPYDYTKGTVEMGDERLKMLAQLKSGRIFVLGHDLVTCIYFSHYKVRLTGAPCWPKKANIHHDITIYEQAGSGYSTAFEAVNARHTLRRKTATERLERDRKLIMDTLKRFEEHSEDEIRIVVTHGCPSPLLCCEADDGKRGKWEKGFVASFKFGPKEDYDYIFRHVDYWIYGAAGDQHYNTLYGGAKFQFRGPGGPRRMTLFLKNSFSPSESKFDTDQTLNVDHDLSETIYRGPGE